MEAILNYFKILLIEKFRYVRHLRDSPIRVLDVGCGNRSPSKTKEIFPKCEYHCIDIQYYNLTMDDISCIEKFYRKDLNTVKLDDIEDNYYDYIILSHILEHLKDPYTIIQECCKKLKPRGFIYIEFPSLKSFSLPSMYGTLHFCDDETHIRFVEISRVINILLDNNFKIIKAGRRRNILRILLTPLICLFYLIKYRKLTAAAFWDLLGFADQVFAQKKG